MPYKNPEDKGWKVTKQKYKLKNQSKYSNTLKDRGRIDFWLDKEAIDNWYEEDQENTGSDAPRQYTDFSVIFVMKLDKYIGCHSGKAKDLSILFLEQWDWI